jgi:hypothetical protein
VSFASLGVREREHLEKWIENNPAILGSNLLILSTEFDKFDRSNERLDLLAIDDKGKLVVVELKRDVSGTFADLQAIRYAAYCSTMTLTTAVELRSQYSGKGLNEAEAEIRSHITIQEFSKLDNKPRIILAAGSFDDQKITSCVLWLRNFGVDISCVEVTPYPFQGSIVLVPRVIIPLPEASEFIVSTERKQATESDLTPGQMEFQKRHEQILGFLREMLPECLPTTCLSSRAPTRGWMQIRTGFGFSFHYEFWFRKEKILHVAFHMEGPSTERNREICEYLMSEKAAIQGAVGGSVVFDPEWSNKWSGIYVPIESEPWREDKARLAAETMRNLINVIQPLLEKCALLRP